ncbi:hypothetical protein [Pedobacter deserti]|uniref:hypothetical protein n=1 Tax=Pedobacter deserti TaxID=2817382 RepID=UPI00210AF5BC|nr:hypothetical protein [Pedobacter sp. SYSU D00382]
MEFRITLIVTLFLSLLSAGCKDRDAAGTPCEHLMNESPGANLTLIFKEAGTGQNLIIAKDLKRSDFVVTDVSSGKPVTYFEVRKGSKQSHQRVLTVFCVSVSCRSA